LNFKYGWIKTTLLGFPGESLSFFSSQIQKRYLHFDIDDIFGGKIWQFNSEILNQKTYLVEYHAEFFLFEERWLPLMSLSHCFFLLIDSFENEKEKRKIHFLLNLYHKYFSNIPLLVIINQNVEKIQNNLVKIIQEFQLNNYIVVNYADSSNWNVIWDNCKKLLDNFEKSAPKKNLHDLSPELIKRCLPIMGEDNEFFSLSKDVQNEIHALLENVRIDYNDLFNLYRIRIDENKFDSFISRINNNQIQ
jgi:hypothetical protein